MSIQNSSSTYGLNESLSSSDQQLFSIYLRYPDDIDGDKQHEDEIVLSSTPQRNCGPGPNTLHAGHADSNGPLLNVDRKSCAGDLPDFDGEWHELISLIQASNLPQACLRYYSLLGESILNLSSQLFGTIRPGKLSSCLDSGHWLLNSASYSNEQASLQVQAVAKVKQSAIFNVKPASSQMWSTYSQRVRMITRNVALPSKQELTLIQCLVFLFNTHVYDGLLRGFSTHADAEALLNDIYDKLMSWLHEYKSWCQGMQDLKFDFLHPLLEEFGKDSKAQDEYSDLQQRLKRLRTAIWNPLPDDAAMTENMVKKLNLSARRPGPKSDSVRSRTRYKREHTL